MLIYLGVLALVLKHTIHDSVRLDANRDGHPKTSCTSLIDNSDPIPLLSESLKGPVFV